MATLPSVFFGDYASGQDLSFLLGNVPKGKGPNYLFDKVRDSQNNQDDVIVGKGKDEIFYVQSGDFAKGKGGYDVVVQAPRDGAHDPLVLHKTTEGGVLTGSEDGNIVGNAKGNNLVGNDGDNLLAGRTGKDVLIGNGGDDDLVGGAGKDTLSGGLGEDNLAGGAGKDKLFGGSGDDHLFGGSGPDKLFGGDGNDELFGASGKDTVLGGAGEDTIFGGGGKDTLIGGGDADVFGFLKGEKGVDVIKDFEPGVDKIDISDFHTDFDSLKFKNSGDDVVVTVGHGKNAVKFKLIGFHHNDVDGSFFQF